MRLNAHQQYIEDEVLTADPLRLVQLLYRAAVEAVVNARRYLRSGSIKPRSRAINKAIEILAELSSSLDYETGGQLSFQLAQLYDYMQRRLIEANAIQTDAPLAEVEHLLCCLEDAWRHVPPAYAHRASLPEMAFPPDPTLAAL